MKVSIITPSYNQVNFLKRTLDSVSSQDYLNIEHIVIDPGSTDGSRAIIEDYSSRRDVVTIFEPDKGQVDAINKGFFRSSGDILTWINSDDYYLDSDAISSVVDVFLNNEDIDVVFGDGVYVDEAGKFIKDAYVDKNCNNLNYRFSKHIGILQPSLFFRKSVFQKLGGLDEKYNLSLDYEYWVRMASNNIRFKYVNKKISGATLHASSKTVGQRGRQFDEICELMIENYGCVSLPWLKRFADFMIQGSDGIVATGNSGDGKLEKSVLLRLFRRFNRNKEKLYEYYKSIKTDDEAAGVLDLWVSSFRKGNASLNVVATCSSDSYFDQLVTLIASVHRTSLEDVDLIVVFDLSLTQEQREFLFGVSKVIVLPFRGRDEKNQWYYQPKSYVYKCHAMAFCSTVLYPMDKFIWIDTGVSVLSSLNCIYDIVDKCGAFFVNHDDVSISPFQNIVKTHRNSLAKMNASVFEAMGEHICSCIIGCVITNEIKGFFRQAYNYSLDREVSDWPKHLSDEERSTNESTRDKALWEKIKVLPKSELDEISFDDLMSAAPYYGHRQDQSIFSLLVARFHYPVFSAKKYCKSTSISSAASKKNWQSGGESSEIVKSSSVPSDVICAITYHHRGVYSYSEGIVLEDNKLSDYDFIEVDGISVNGKFNSSGGLPLANKYFREGKYRDALVIYLRLYRNNPLSIYEANAIFAAKKMNICNVCNINDILNNDFDLV